MRYECRTSVIETTTLSTGMNMNIRTVVRELDACVSLVAPCMMARDSGGKAVSFLSSRVESEEENATVGRVGAGI